MATATITSKGQVTIPAAVRAELHLDTGDQLDFVPLGQGRFELVNASRRPIQALKGLIGKPSRPVSIEDMNAAIAAGGSRAK